LIEACKVRARKECSSKSSEKRKDCRKKSRKFCRKIQLRKRQTTTIGTTTGISKIPTEEIIDVVTTTTPKDTRAIPQKQLDQISDLLAIEKCGTGSDKKECRDKVKKEIKEKEIDFRKTALKACKCRSKTQKKCKGKGEKCRRRNLRSCRRKCLIEACKVRARKECSSKSSEKRKDCRKKSRKFCRKIHLRKIQTITTGTTNESIGEAISEWTIEVVITTIPKDTRMIPEKQLDRALDKIALKKCGKGSENKKCRDKLKKELREKEIEFREKALEACKCRSKAKEKCKGKGKKCRTRNFTSLQKKMFD